MTQKKFFIILVLIGLISGAINLNDFFITFLFGAIFGILPIVTYVVIFSFFLFILFILLKAKKIERKKLYKIFVLAILGTVITGLAGGFPFRFQWFFPCIDISFGVQCPEPRIEWFLAISDLALWFSFLVLREQAIRKIQKS